MTVSRGKRMTFAQQVGSTGEKFFAYWASQHRLLATKAEDDIGIDYLCQVLGPVAASRSLEGQGSMLGAQVKSVASSATPRAVLDRFDATALLKQSQATCLFGVELDTKTVRFRFLDKDFVDLLLAFLAGTNDSWSLPFSELSGDIDEFYAELFRVTNSFFQQRLRIHQAQRRLESAIPGAAVSIKSSNDLTSSHVHVRKVHDAYIIDEMAADEARIQIFERGYLDPAQDGINLHPEIERIVKETQSSALILFGAIGEVVEVKIRMDGKEESAEFEVREYKDEVSLVHKAGLRLTVSAARKDSLGYVHALENDLFVPEEPFAWDLAASSFFELFGQGAELVLPDGRVWSVKMFGDSLEHLGSAITTYRAICEALKRSNDFALIDLRNEELAHSANFLNAFLFEGWTAEKLIQGFVLGPGGDEPIGSLGEEAFAISLPVALNWKDLGVVVWIQGETQGLRYQGKLCGFRMTKQLDWAIKTYSRFEKSLYPEAWFCADWPPIPIGRLNAGVSTFSYDGHELPLEADLKLLATDQLE